MKLVLHLENFKGFEECKLELAPLTLLIGANSTGKSSVFQAIKILANQREFRDSDLRNGTKGGLIKLSLENEEITIELPPPPERPYYPLENVHHLSAVRYNLKRELTKIEEFPTQLGIHGENLYEILIADALASIATGERKFKILDKINEFLREIDAGFYYQPKIEIIPVPDGLPKVKFSLNVIDKGVEVNIVDAGFGYTQFLYVSAFILSANSGSHDKPVFLLLEEPAAHLYQKLVVELFDIIWKQLSANKFVLIETHSEHILMRLRRRVTEGKIAPSDVAVYFFKKEQGKTWAEKVEIDEYGELSESFPPDFFSKDFEDLIAISKTWRRHKNGDNNG